MTARFHHLRALIVGVLVLALGAVIALSVGSTAAPVAHAQAPSDTPYATAIGTYAVFARPSTARDDVSRWRIPVEAQQRMGLQLHRARTVYADATRTVAAVPAADGTCLIQQFDDGGGGVNCGGADRPTVILGYDGAIGLMPDSVKAVTFTMTDGSTETGQVVANVWHSPVEAAKVAFTIGGTTQNVDLMPRSSLPPGATLHANGLVTSGDSPLAPSK